MEGTGILRYDIERSAKRAERPPMKTMAVRSAVNIWSSRMNSRMDHESCGVQHPIRSAGNDLAVVVYLDQVRGFHQLECCAERINPECCRVDRIPDSDMSGDTWWLFLVTRSTRDGDTFIPSSYPLSPKILNAAARRPLRYSRSLNLSSKTGMLGICIFTFAFSAPAA